MGELCDVVELAGENVHRCLLEPGHEEDHECVCGRSWQRERIEP